MAKIISVVINAQLYLNMCVRTERGHLVHLTRGVSKKAVRVQCVSVHLSYTNALLLTFRGLMTLVSSNHRTIGLSGVSSD